MIPKLIYSEPSWPGPAQVTGITPLYLGAVESYTTVYQLLKEDAVDMVRFLGPVPSVKAILDKLNSLYSSVSSFDIMMQGFYRKFQERGKSVTCYLVRLEGKLNEIQVKHPNRVSEVETTG